MNFISFPNRVWSADGSSSSKVTKEDIERRKELAKSLGCGILVTEPQERVKKSSAEKRLRSLLYKLTPEERRILLNEL